MSQENVEVVALAASGRSHVWHPDAEIIAFGFDLVFGEVWTVCGGRIIRAQGYRDRAEALEAAGLSE